MLMIAFRKKSALHLNEYQDTCACYKNRREQNTGISRNLGTQKQSQSVEILLANQKQKEGAEIAG